jgi:ATP-dependent Lon protease
MKKCSLGLIGAPGTGKTMISRLLAKVLEFPFEQISLGGISNPDFLKGHQYTYIGAEPGEIAKCMKRMQYKNGILFLDEFDKISENKYIYSSLLHITDPMQNSEFRDNFLSDITIDLSYLWFIYSMNKLPTDSALKDRVYIIEVPGYNLDDKIHILRDYLFPKALKNINKHEDSIIIHHDIAKYLVEKVSYPEDEGVRTLEQNVNTIVNKIDFLVQHNDKKGKINSFNLSFDLNKQIQYPVKLTKQIIDIMLKNIQS